MKIFSTQLQGVFRKITEQEEENIEDGSRLLAQGAAGSGRVFICGTTSMKGIASTLSTHEDAPSSTVYMPHIEKQEIDPFDRILILTEKNEGEELAELIRPLKESDIPVVIIGPFSEEEKDPALNPMDVWIDTHVRGGIVPDDKGNRIGFPSALCTLFTGQLLYLNLKEMLDELEE